MSHNCLDLETGTGTRIKKIAHMSHNCLNLKTGIGTPIKRIAHMSHNCDGNWNTHKKNCTHVTQLS